MSFLYMRVILLSNGAQPRKPPQTKLTKNPALSHRCSGFLSLSTRMHNTRRDQAACQTRTNLITHKETHSYQEILPCAMWRSVYERTGGSTPNRMPLMAGRFCEYAMRSLSSRVLLQTMFPLAEVTTSPPQLQADPIDIFQVQALSTDVTPGHTCGLSKSA